MAQGTRSQKNVPPSSISPSLLKESVSPGEVTPTPSDVGPPDAPTPDAPVPAPAPAHYFKEDFQSIMKICMDSILQAQVIRLTKLTSHQEG